jgi:hypothetical protein
MSMQSAIAVRLNRPVPVRLILAASALLVGLVGLLAAITPAGDAVLDQGARAGQAFGGFQHVSWVWLPLLVAIAASHYGFAAVALRAASGLRLRLPEAVLAQLAAAAANRLMPLGLGGAAVNTRYLTRRGLPPAGAVGSVGALQILGPLTDVAVVLGVLLAVPGAVAESLHLVSGIGLSIERLGPTIHRYAAPALWWARWPWCGCGARSMCCCRRTRGRSGGPWPGASARSGCWCAGRAIWPLRPHPRPVRRWCWRWAS